MSSSLANQQSISLLFMLNNCGCVTVASHTTLDFYFVTTYLNLFRSLLDYVAGVVLFLFLAKCLFVRACFSLLVKRNSGTETRLKYLN